MMPSEQNGLANMFADISACPSPQLEVQTWHDSASPLPACGERVRVRGITGEATRANR
jgi:hypothetical protein